MKTQQIIQRVLASVKTITVATAMILSSSLSISLYAQTATGASLASDSSNFLFSNVKKVSVYPNPVTSLLSIEINESLPSAKVFLINSLGQVIEKVDAGDFEIGRPIEWDMTDRLAGIYFVRVATDSRSTDIRVIKR